jgi:hypothetical protein
VPDGRRQKLKGRSKVGVEKWRKEWNTGRKRARKVGGKWERRRGKKGR